MNQPIIGGPHIVTCLCSQQQWGFNFETNQNKCVETYSRWIGMNVIDAVGSDETNK